MELDRIISDIFSLTKGGSASKDILPEPEVCKLCDIAKEILQVAKLSLQRRARAPVYVPVLP